MGRGSDCLEPALAGPWLPEAGGLASSRGCLGHVFSQVVGGLWAGLGRVFGCLGHVLGCLGLSWGRLETCRDSLGMSKDSKMILGTFLVLPWGCLGLVLGLSWAWLGPALGHLRLGLGPFSAISGLSWAILGLSWTCLEPS